MLKLNCHSRILYQIKSITRIKAKYRDLLLQTLRRFIPTNPLKANVKVYSSGKRNEIQMKASDENCKNQGKSKWILTGKVSQSLSAFLS